MTNARPERTTDASHEPPEMASPRVDSQMELFPELPSRLRTLPTFKAKTAVGDHVPWSDHPTAVDFPSVVDSINAAYAEVVHWKKQLVFRCLLEGWGKPLWMNLPDSFKHSENVVLWSQSP